ncbi:allantoinase AllB [Ornithinimicrobium faecis]|uniref:allantoinase n=1 Tax=Ornithinimicrobium faecis TaxID=2934158 RepID=A0ABY4YVA8_9MICO|nr:MULTISPECIES: allantoinase AllB [unclassified Ornithinimicrobium]USQ80686.1 allantoinase AllB [Ornithinimicrobium sp. HY1793]
MAERHDLVVCAERVLAEGVSRESDGFVPLEIGIRDGVITTLAPLGAGLAGAQVRTLAADEVLLPGLVDSHVHINEPGRTDWEGFDSATRAAAAGGVTTVIDMPLNSIPPTVTTAALATKIAASDGIRHVDVGFWGGAVPGNTADLAPLHEAGVFGFKSFLLPSGVDEFPALDADELEVDLHELAGLDALMVVHAEDAEVIEHAPPAHGPDYADFLASRPRAAENRAIAVVIEAARRTGARVHILHLSSSDALGLIADARRDGVHLSVETCPHYLTLTAEDVPAGATTYKCCPPIRERANQDLLWAALAEGTIDAVVSDHSPSTADLKQLDTGDFGQAWGGVASLQLGLPVMWTAARERGIGLDQVVRWLSAGPAHVAGLARKGRIAVGADADLVVFAPEQTFVVDPATLEHKNHLTAYAGRTLAGVVRTTVLRGTEVDFRTPRGALLRRGHA